MSEKIRVLVANDYEIRRQVIYRLLQEAWGIEIVGAALHLDDVLEAATVLHPDVILLRDNLPPAKSSDETTKALREQAIPSAILIIANKLNPGLIRRSLNNGADGVLSEDDTWPYLVEAIEHVHKEDFFYLSPKAKQALTS